MFSTGPYCQHCKEALMRTIRMFFLAEIVLSVALAVALILYRHGYLPILDTNIVDWSGSPLVIIMMAAGFSFAITGTVGLMVTSKE